MGDRLKFPTFQQMTAVGSAGAPGGFSASRELAAFCDQVLPELDFRAQAARGAKVLDLVEALPPALSRQLQDRFGPGILTELVSLEKERDPELFFSSLLNLAGRLAQREGTTLTALGLYHRIEIASGIQELTSLAGQRRQALQGGGNFGAKAEIFLRAMGKEVGDYRNLLGAFVGATLASGLYKYTFYRMGRTAAAGLAARGIGPATYEAAMMRLKSRVFGFTAASLGASLADRGLRTALGQKIAWDPNSVARDAVATSLNLFAWRLASGFSNSYTLRALGAEAQPKNFIRKELEIFAFRQSLGAASLGLAMVANQQLFGGGPDNRTAAFTQLALLSAGMNIGGIAGAKALHLSH